MSDKHWSEASGEYYYVSTIADQENECQQT